MVASAHAQEQAPAVVTQVVDGDTLDARLQDGRVIRVRLIGIDAPRALEPGAPAECGGPQAREELERLVQGREVILTNDASQGFVDAVGRALLYVDRASDGLDAGEQMLRRGRATVLVGDRAFARLPVYRRAQGAARNRRAGAWEACEGNFHLNPEEQARDDRRELLRSAVRFMRGYYAAVSARRFRAAWRRLVVTHDRSAVAGPPVARPGGGAGPPEISRSGRMQQSGRAAALPYELDARSPWAVVARRSGGGPQDRRWARPDPQISMPAAQTAFAWRGPGARRS